MNSINFHKPKSSHLERIYTFFRSADVKPPSNDWQRYLCIAYEDTNEFSAKIGIIWRPVIMEKIIVWARIFYILYASISYLPTVFSTFWATVNNNTWIDPWTPPSIDASFCWIIKMMNGIRSSANASFSITYYQKQINRNLSYYWNSAFFEKNPNNASPLIDSTLLSPIRMSILFLEIILADWFTCKNFENALRVSDCILCPLNHIYNIIFHSTQ